MLNKAKEELRVMALYDELTGLHNRRALEDHLHWSIHNAARRQEPMTLAIIDIDHFKVVNDVHGHPTGDALLIDVAKAIRESCRDSDFTARYGGEEFLVVLPKCDVLESFNIAKRIRKAVSQIDLIKENITVSIGLATLHCSRTKDSNIEVLRAGLYDMADNALYQAKNQGRNREIHGGMIDNAEAQPHEENFSLPLLTPPRMEVRPGRFTELYGP